MGKVWRGSAWVLLGGGLALVVMFELLDSDGVLVQLSMVPSSSAGSTLLLDPAVWLVAVLLAVVNGTAGRTAAGWTRRLRDTARPRGLRAESCSAERVHFRRARHG